MPFSATPFLGALNRPIMPLNPLCEYFTGQKPLPLDTDSSQWRAPLPLERIQGGTAVFSDAAPGDLTYGDYFAAVRAFLSADEWAVAIRAAGVGFQSTIGCFAPDRARIHLIKHGAFYHPAHVMLAAGPEHIDLLVNVAISQAGCARWPAEVACLEHLTRNFAETYVPRVYGWGIERAGGRDIALFAVQWLADYHEIHPSRRTHAEAPQWLVWDAGRGNWLLSAEQVAQFFRQAVFILTYYFDPSSLSAILEWHHAAGDFIIQQDQHQGLNVRLITVRRYEPLFHLAQERAPDLEELIDALVIFFMRTCLWMRLDRLDGTGDLVWAGDQTLAPMWQGFVLGVRRMASLNKFPETFADQVIRYFAGFEADQLHTLCLRIMERLPPQSPETQLIRQHVRQHAATLAQVVKG